MISNPKRLPGSRTKDLSGQKFKRLVVERLDHRKESSGLAYWRCLCDCGNVTVVRHAALTSGTCGSCGCLQKELASSIILKEIKRRTLQSGHAARNNLFLTYQNGAKRRGLEFSISVEEFLVLTEGVCRYCGTTPKQVYQRKRSNGSYTYNGVDRLNNNIGYVSDNCVSCCHSCNRAKSSMKEEEFLSLIKAIYEFRNLEHHPVDDARGNAEAMLHMFLNMGLK